MTAFLRVVVGALLVATSAGSTALATAGPAPLAPPAAASSRPDHGTVEVWRVHPDRRAARAASLTLRIDDVSRGDGGAVMVVEDRHVPATPFDTAGVYGFAYAELGDDALYPHVYDNPAGVASPACPVPDSCAGLDGTSLDGEPLEFTFSKVVGPDHKPIPYDFHDFYVGAVNAHLTVLPKDDGWTVSRATGVDMVLVQNSDTAQGVGAHVGNYTVEKFGGDIAVTTPAGSWSEAFAGLPCSVDAVGIYPVPQDRASFAGFTIPYGRRSIPLSCAGNHFDNAMASGATTWRLTVQPPSGELGGATSMAPTQNLNRLVVLIVNRPKPAAHSSMR